jgi:predicted lipid-binding transport protein (Tim44 family)
MSRVRRLAAPLAVTALVLPATAQARGGGGSFGFGGGGGGGGGFGGGGGGHVPIFIPIGGGGGGTLLFLFLLGMFIVARSIRAQRPPGTTSSAGLHVREHLRAARVIIDYINPFARRRRAKRQREVELAAHEAAEDDGAFAPEVVHEQAERLFREVQKAWTADDRERLSQLAGPELFAEWDRRLSDFARRGWQNQVAIQGAVEVLYVGLVNREGTGEDHVTVRISARLSDVVVDRSGRALHRKDSFGGDVARMVEYWTLAQRDGRWIVVSIEQEQEGRHAMSEAIVATPWSDTERLTEASLAEQAAAEKAPATQLAEIATPEFGDAARAAALDLSLVDGRFAPDLLAAEVRRAVAAWAQAVDGDRGDLAAAATPEAAQRLLTPQGPRSRLVVRGPHVQQIRIVSLDAQAQPAHMDVELEVRGYRYVEDRDTTEVLSGSPDLSATFTERWRLELDGDDAHPWRIAA